MKSVSDFILAEMGGVEEVVQEARSIESARRGSTVDSHDMSVQVLAAEMIINGAGAEIRRRCNEAATGSGK